MHQGNEFSSFFVIFLFWNSRICAKPRNSTDKGMSQIFTLMWGFIVSCDTTSSLPPLFSIVTFCYTFTLPLISMMLGEQRILFPIITNALRNILTCGSRNLLCKQTSTMVVLWMVSFCPLVVCTGWAEILRHHEFKSKKIVCFEWGAPPFGSKR